MTSLMYPFTESAVRALRAGDTVEVSGKVFTGRDRLHKFLAEGGTVPVDLTDGALFHCGPVVVPAGDTWRVVAAGPTTSIREEPYAASIIRDFHVRVIIGKGGMGAATRAACKTYGCVYLQAVGGAAAVTAQCISRVEDVLFLDTFGATEAMWQLDIRGLRAIVGMDAQGNSLFDSVAESSAKVLQRLDSAMC